MVPSVAPAVLPPAALVALRPWAGARASSLVVQRRSAGTGVSATASASASDEELMSAYVAGDARAFELLFARFAPRVHAFFARTFRSGAVADDLLQTTFLKLHAARASWAQDRPVRPWLFGIAARVRIDELRRRYRKAEVGDEALEAMSLPPPEGGGHDAWPEANEAAERVRRAVDALPEGQRVVVLLHRFEGMTFGEIATTLSGGGGKAISEVAVRVRAFRAYEALRTALADLDERGESAERAVAGATREEEGA